MFLIPNMVPTLKKNATMILSPEHEYQFKIQIVNQKTYFPSRESNLIISRRYIVKKKSHL